MNIKKYLYLTKKIQNAEFCDYPFKHIFIEDFLSKEDFDLLTSQPNINIPKQTNTIELIKYLQQCGYHNIQFPGCITDINKYINDIQNKVTLNAGLAFKLTTYLDARIKHLLNFLNSRVFHAHLRKKFEIYECTKIHTTIQKYLDGYQISPHPDIRRKALTYLININTTKDVIKENIHTQLFKFKPEFEYIKNFWKNNTNVDRCWLPWDCCVSEKTVFQNNSIIIFAPSCDTLHGVKLDYNHLNFQRTQIYGNLMFYDSRQYENIPFIKIPNK